MIDRRGFLKNLAALPLIGFANIKDSPKAQAIAKILVNFNNGDNLEIFICEVPGEPGQYACISNSMNHYESIMTTSYEIENMFKCGELYQYNPQKPIIEYRGYDRFGDLVYEGIADNKTWITL